MSPFFPPKWAGGLPDTVARISKASDILFDESVNLLDNNGFSIVNRSQNRNINISLKAWQSYKLFGFVLEKKYIPQKQFREFNYVYLRSLFEDEAPEQGELFETLCSYMMPYQERYLEDISLFTNDLCIYITGHVDKQQGELLSPLIEHTSIIIYYYAAILFKDRRGEAELKRYLESF